MKKAKYTDMQVCVESLYTLDGNTDKRRTMEMIRVMKGAINISQSRTGDVSYRYNRHEGRILDRQLTIFAKGINQAENNAVNKKRDILRKWNLVFGQKRGVAESIRNFDQMLTTAIGLRDTPKYRETEGMNVIQGTLLHSSSNENKHAHVSVDDFVFDEHMDIRHTSISCIDRDIQNRPVFTRRSQKTTLPSIQPTQGFIRRIITRNADELEERKKELDAGERRSLSTCGSSKHQEAKEERRKTREKSEKSTIQVISKKYQKRLKGLPTFEESSVGSFSQKQNEERKKDPSTFEKSLINGFSSKQDERSKVLPTFERSMISGFLHKQKTLQENLVTRNMLSKMKTNLDSGHAFYKHRFKTMLPDTATLLVQTIERERTILRLNGLCNSLHTRPPHSRNGCIISTKKNQW